MPRAPITPSIVAGPVGRGTYSAQDVAQVQPQQPGMLVQQGQQLQRLGGALEDVAEVQRIKQVRSLAIEQDTKLAESFRNSRSEFGKLQGRKAVDAFPEYEKSIRESAKKLLEGIKDPLAQRLIRESADQRIQQNLNEAAAYRDKQQEAWLDGAEQAAVLGAVEDYKLGVRDGDKNADRFFVTALKEQRQMDERKGLSPEQRRVNELALTTMLHGGVVEGMIERGEGIKAFQYIETNKKEMAADFYAKQQPQAKAAFVDQAASRLTQTVPSFAERLRLVDEMPDLSNEDRASAKRVLSQKANEEDANNAQIAQDVEQRLNAYYAANPSKELGDNPALMQEVTRYGVNPARTRVTDNRWFQQVSADDDAGKLMREELRSLNPAQLRLRLSHRLNSHDESQLTAFLRGDQSLASIKERTTMLARSLGYLPEGADKATPDQTRAFTAWVANTIDPIVAAQRDKLGRDLNVEEFQKLVVNPIQNDKAMLRATDLGVDWTDKDWGPFPMETMRLKGYAPIDNPDTQEDESLNFDKYKDLYVDVEGQQVFLYEIPMEERKNIRDAWSLNPANRGRFMSAADEAREWVKAGRRGDRKLETTKEAPSYQGVMDPAEFPVQVGASRLDHIWSDGKSIRQGSTAYPGYQPPKK